jgi:flagellar motor protein MotB
MGWEVLLLLLTLSMIGNMILAANANRLQENLAKTTSQEVVERNKKLEAQVCAMAEELKKLGMDAEKLKKLQAEAKNDQPPIIALSEAGGWSFTSGSADVDATFEAKLRDKIVPQILTLAATYGTDIIEVVGHTDETVMYGKMSTLDRDLLLFLSGQANEIVALGSNADLGLSRAVTVAKFLLNDTRITGGKLQVLPLSAGQTQMPDGSLATGTTKQRNDQARRRIEIRLRRSQ